MTKETIEDLKLKAEELIAVPHCAPELKEAAKAWMASIGTADEKELGKAFIKELEEDVMPIDATIAFFKTKDAAEKFGKDIAQKLGDEAAAAKEAGAKFCNCAACKAGEAILNLKEKFFTD